MNTHGNVARLMLVAAIAFMAFGASAQVPQYGSNITLEQARKALAAGEAEARKRSWPVAIAIVDNAGLLVAYMRMDNTQTASAQIAVDKAVSAAMFRRSTKEFFDRVAGGGAGVTAMNLRGAMASEGGMPIVIDGKIVGGIGISGMAGSQDAVIAQAGVDSLK